MGILTAIRAARESLDRDTAPITLELRNLSLDNPAVSLSSPAAYQILSGSYPTISGEAITTESALHISTVYGCVRVIANGVAGMPAKVYEIVSGGRNESVDHSLYYMLTASPNPEMTAYSLFSALAMALTLTGNCYAQIERNALGQAVALWPLHPTRTEPTRKANGSLVYMVTNPETGAKTELLPKDVIHVPLFCFDGLKGYSPVELARQGLGLAKAAEKYAAGYFGTGGQPSGLMHTIDDVSIDELTVARDSWNSQRAGAGSAGKTVFTAGNWTYTPLSLSQRDAQFIESRRFQREDICALWGVPPNMVGDPGKLSNGNWEQQALSLLLDTLQPYCEAIAQELHRKLLGPDSRFQITFDPTARLRADRKSLMESVALSRQWAVMTTDESRQQLGLNPLGGEVGSLILAPVNMMPADRLLKSPAQLPQPADDSASRSLISDCIGHLMHRSVRDADAVREVFTPAVTSVVSTIAARAARDMHLADTRWAAAIADDVIRQIAKRDQPDADKILRTIILNVYREAGAALAEGIHNV